MWPFKTHVKSLADSGMLKGFTDWHSHILPGVDDGIKTLEDSLNVLKAYEDYGFKKVWLTPHIMEDYPNTSELLRQKYEELKNAYDGAIELGLAAENMIDNLFEERLEANDILPIGLGGDHILVETSYFNPPMGFRHILDSILSSGYYPLLAHPERYTYMNTKDYDSLRQQGVKFQMNLISIVGGFGKTAQKKAEWLLDNSMVDLVGTDIHRLNSTAGWLTKSPTKQKYLDLAAEIARNPLHI